VKIESGRLIMSYLESKEECEQLILAGYPLIYVVTDEERPVIETMNLIAKNYKNKLNVYSWNSSGGLFLEKGKKLIEAVTDPYEMLKKIKEYNAGNAIFILHDFHLLFHIPELLMELKDTVLNISVPFTSEFSLKRYKNAQNHLSKHIVITAPVQQVPPELNKLMTIVRFSLPGKLEIENIINRMINKTKKYKIVTSDQKEKIIQASLGLTETEIFNSFLKSMVSNGGKIVYKDIFKEKKQIINKDGTLQYEETNVSIKDIGGLKYLTDWIKKRKIAFDVEIRKQYNLSLPKGILMTGIQGCGKSYTAKAIAKFLEVPFIRLDIGAIMNKWLGQSEENMRKAISIAESISPCVLFIDEIDKAIPDPANRETHEVTQRLLSTLLTWLQEKESPVFVVATANNIHHLPPELMRKGRFDEIFFIDLPKDFERKEIFKIHLTKKQYDPNNFDLEKMVAQTNGYSGSEIEALINEGIFQAAYEKSKVTTKHLLNEIKKTNPLSVTMGDKIKQIQEWAKKNNIRPAS
jgi:SpoVK/Ycf46/Vps4 family AAA+-type ATPase